MELIVGIGFVILIWIISMIIFCVFKIEVNQIKFKLNLLQFRINELKEIINDKL